jgi:hypothetical protein
VKIFISKSQPSSSNSSETGAEIQKLQQIKKIGPISKFPGFLQDVLFIFLCQLAAISEQFEPEGPNWAYFLCLFKLSLFFLYLICFGPNLCKIRTYRLFQNVSPISFAYIS